jgi:hypothetical protein
MSRRFTNLDHVRSWVFTPAVAGTAEQLGIKYIAASTLTFANNLVGGPGDTITDSAKKIYTAGFRTGDQLTVSGAVNNANNRTFVIASIDVTGSIITLTTSGVLVNESPTTTVTLTTPITIPEGISLTIHAPKANTGIVYIGQNQLNAQGQQCFTLSPADTVFLQLRISSIAWINVANTGDNVQCIVEQNKQGQE